MDPTLTRTHGRRNFITALVGALLLTLAAPRARSLPAPIAFPTFGVTITPPQGYSPLPGAKAGIIGRWGKASPRTGQVAAAVMAEVEVVGPQSAQQYAATLAQRIGGKVEKAPSSIGGVKAIRVTAAAAPQGATGPRPHVALIAKREQCVYVLSTFDSPDDPADDALDAVRNDWKWTAPEPPARTVTSMSEPFPVLGKLWIRTPVAARPYDVKDAKSQSHLGVTDYAAGAPVMDIDVTALPPGADLGRARDVVSQMIARDQGAAQAPGWTDQGGRPRRLVSSPIEKANPNGPTVVTRYALLELGEQQTGLLTLQYILVNPGDRTAYESANEAIIRSVRSPDAGATEPVASNPTASAPSGPRGDGSIQIKRKAPKTSKP